MILETNTNTTTNTNTIQIRLIEIQLMLGTRMSRTVILVFFLNFSLEAFNHSISVKKGRKNEKCSKVSFFADSNLDPGAPPCHGLS